MSAARLADRDDLAPLLALFAASEVSLPASGEAARAIWDEMIGHPAVATFVVENDGAILATAGYQLYREQDPERHDQEVVELTEDSNRERNRLAKAHRPPRSRQPPSHATAAWDRERLATERQHLA